MKRYILLLITPIALIAEIHYAKIEPFDSVVLKSAVSAQVQKVNLAAEGKMVHNGEVIHLDDSLDRIDLNSSKSTLELLYSMLAINEEMLLSLEETYQRQEGYYQRISQLSTASKTQKDTAFGSFVTAKNQFFATKEKIENLKSQILDMKSKIARLQDSIDKKSIRLKDQYLYKLSVREGDYVAPGSPLATLQDLSQGKLTLYLEPSELENIQHKKIYIDGKETSYTIDKIWRATDEKYISSYKAEIYIDKPEDIFSKLVKVEIK